MLELPAQGRALGVITPSGNVVVEWTAISLLHRFPGIGVHFSRIKVAGAVDPYPDGYDMNAMSDAAGLLADAQPGVLVWAGSKGVLVGLDRERELSRRLEDSTGIPVTSATLALCTVAERAGLSRVGLVTPYTDAYQRRLVEGFARIGIECVAERHAGIADNLAYATVGAAQIVEMAREVMSAADGHVDALLGWCTNLPTAALAADIEAEHGVPFYDATTLALWGGLSALRCDLAAAAACGRLFRDGSGLGLEN